MLTRFVIASITFCLLFQTGQTFAADTEQEPSIFDHWQLYFYLGDYHAESARNKLESPGSEFAFGIGGLFDYSKYIDWGFDAIAISRDYDTPGTVSGGPFTVVSEDMSMTTLGLTINARLKYTAGIAEIYAGGGTGLYFSKLVVTGSTLGFVGSHEERSTDVGYFYNYGATFEIANKHRLGLEYRKVFLDGDFSPVTTEKVDIGGDFLLVNYYVMF